MSLYRDARAGRRRRRLLAGGAAAAVVLAGVVIALVAGGSGTSRADQRAEGRAAVQTAADGLELVGIEYPQAVRAGAVVAPTEYRAAQADVARAERAITSRRRRLAAGRVRTARRALLSLRRAVERREPAARVEEKRRAAVRAVAALRP